MQSVGFTAAPFFAIAAVWFLVFGISLFFICCCYCCCPREPYGYSRIAYALSLIFLVLFTVAAMYFSWFLSTKYIHVWFMLHYMIVWIRNLWLPQCFVLQFQCWMHCSVHWSGEVPQQHNQHTQLCCGSGRYHCWKPQ